MRDFKNVRWNADQQRWSGGAPEGAPGGRKPGQLIVPAVALAALIVLVVLVAIGVRAEGSTDKTDQASVPAPSDEVSEGHGNENREGQEKEEEPENQDEQESQKEREEQEEQGEPENQEEEKQEGEVAPESESYLLHEDAKGFELLVPVGWERREMEAPEGVLYSGENERYLVQIMELWADPDTPYSAMARLKSRASNTKPEYEERDRRDIHTVPQSVELDYTYDNEVHGLQAVSLGTFYGGDNQVQAIQVEGPAEEWALTQQHFRVAVDSFCVTDHDCS